MGFMPGVRAGQSMASISCCARKAVVSHTVWGVALSWTHTFSFVQKPMMQRWWLKVPSSTTSSLLLPWWMTPYHDLPSVGWMRACISLFPCMQRSGAQREARRHRKSHFLCVLLQTRLRRLWSKFNLGHSGMPRAIASRQKLFYNAPKWQPPLKSVDHPHAYTEKEPRWNDCLHLNQLSVFSGCGQTPPIPKPAVADQYLGCVKIFCWRLLATHPTFSRWKMQND